MAVKSRLRGFRRAFPPQRLDAIVSGYDLASVKQQEREQCAVLSPRRGQIDAVGVHLELPQQPELHFVPIVPRSLSPA
jgi:dUTPase